MWDATVPIGTQTTEERTFADRAEFHRWAEGQPRGRYERLGGLVVPISPER